MPIAAKAHEEAVAALALGGVDLRESLPASRAKRLDQSSIHVFRHLLDGKRRRIPHVTARAPISWLQRRARGIKADFADPHLRCVTSPSSLSQPRGRSR